MKHPIDRAARKRLAEAKALEKLIPKKINAKKKLLTNEIREQEAEEEILHAFNPD